MKITKKVSDLLNEQFYNELYAAHIYFAISASMRLTPYQGVAKWMRMQAKEEMEHAEKIYEYLVESPKPTFLPRRLTASRPPMSTS